MRFVEGLNCEECYKKRITIDIGDYCFLCKDCAIIYYQKKIKELKVKKE